MLRQSLAATRAPGRDSRERGRVHSGERCGRGSHSGEWRGGDMLSGKREGVGSHSGARGIAWKFQTIAKLP